MPAVAGAQGFKDPMADLPDLAQTSGCFRVVDADIVKTYSSAQLPDYTLRYGADLSNGAQKEDMSVGNKMLLSGATMGLSTVFMKPDLNDQQNALVTLSIISNRTGATVFTATGKASGQVSKLSTDGSNALVRAAMIDGFNQLVDGFHPAQAAKKPGGHKKKSAHTSPPVAQN
ncbi:MAG: hypothetical protein P4L72_15785 [Parvibaculum sp.]|uniref:hypothetical protein n=1 Tax=Parvibaculum sp. TaxID=2024848 RepID=UPI00284F53EE|nr:hypothetical protein [Parvibaculum sp.]MDR3500675.1 hypothetical protein [Parvibaculum sp.]